MTRVPPPVHFVLGALLAFALRLAICGDLAPGATAIIAGGAAFVVGLVFAGDAVIRFIRAGTNIDPTRAPTVFIPNGSYRLSRNPMYVGMTAILLGAAILSETLIAFAVPVVFLLILDRLHVPMEERWMERTFGHSFAEYRARVRRWL